MGKFMLKGLLTDNDLEKLNSMEGIIDLLCDIPNFNMDMYDELDEDKISLVDHTLSINLLTDSQIESNLRRSMDNNNLALINKKRLMALSLLYFGIKDENNKYVGYICPYTGKEYNLSDMYYELRKPYSERNKEKVLELEHIRPHSIGGGTVLFNCIPSSKEANNFSEKSDLHLLDWFNQSGSKYYDKERLYNLVSYTLSAYSISFREYQESDLDYYENDINNDLEIDNDELENVKEYKEKVKNKKHILIEGYIPFLKQLINKLETEGYDVSLFNNKLVELENNNIISNINKYEIVQDVIENLFKEYSGDENTSYLTYSLNIDYIKLVNSINSNDRQEIETILRTRLSNIKYLVDINSKTMKDYFISLRDNQEVDIIYKENSSQEEIQSFVENLKLSYDTKINIFIKMLSEDNYTSYENGKPNKKNIFSAGNNALFEGTSVVIKEFWLNNAVKIKEKLDEQEKKYISKNDESGLKEIYKVKQAITVYEIFNSIENKIKLFIEMLNQNTIELSTYINSNFIVTLKEYNGKYVKKECQKIGWFWNDNKERILYKLFKDETKDNKYKNARKKIIEHLMMDAGGKKSKVGISLRKKLFIEMLNLNNIKLSNKIGNRFAIYVKDEIGNYLKNHNGDYMKKEYDEIGYFWSIHKDEIFDLLFENVNYIDEKYDFSRKKIIDYYMLDSGGQKSNKGQEIRKKVFIEMLNLNRINLSSFINDKFTIYEKDKNGNYLKNEKNEYVKREEYDLIGSFWSNNQDDIYNLLFNDDKYNYIKYNNAREKIIDYFMLEHGGQQSEKGILFREQCFIEMLNNNPLQLSRRMKEKFTIYKKDENENYIKDSFGNFIGIEYGPVGAFFCDHLDDIYNLLFNNNEYNGSKYDIARERIINYFMFDVGGQRSKKGQEIRRNAFIEMLNSNKLNLSQRMKEKFVLYEKEYDEIGPYWSNNKEKYIIPTLFYNKYYDAKENKYIDSNKDYSGPEYDNARKNILEYLSLRNDKIKSIEDYIDELDKKDKKTKQVQNLIDLRDSLRDKDIRLIRYEKELIEENMELKESISNTIRRAM